MPREWMVTKISGMGPVEFLLPAPRGRFFETKDGKRQIRHDILTCIRATHLTGVRDFETEDDADEHYLRMRIGTLVAGAPSLFSETVSRELVGLRTSSLPMWRAMFMAHVWGEFFEREGARLRRRLRRRG